MIHFAKVVTLSHSIEDLQKQRRYKTGSEPGIQTRKKGKSSQHLKLETEEEGILL